MLAMEEMGAYHTALSLYAGPDSLYTLVSQVHNIKLHHNTGALQVG